MTRTESRDIAPDDSGGGRLIGRQAAAADQDPIASLHDTSEGVGDEAGLADMLAIDAREAKELGVDLDAAGGREAELD